MVLWMRGEAIRQGYRGTGAGSTGTQGRTFLWQLLGNPRHSERIRRVKRGVLWMTSREWRVARIVVAGAGMASGAHGSLVGFRKQGWLDFVRLAPISLRMTASIYVTSFPDLDR